MNESEDKGNVDEIHLPFPGGADILFHSASTSSLGRCVYGLRSPSSKAWYFELVVATEDKGAFFAVNTMPYQLFVSEMTGSDRADDR